MLAVVRGAWKTPVEPDNDHSRAVAQELAERKAAWSQKRRAYEAAQAKAVADRVRIAEQERAERLADWSRRRKAYEAAQAKAQQSATTPAPAGRPSADELPPVGRIEDTIRTQAAPLPRWELTPSEEAALDHRYWEDRYAPDDLDADEPDD